MIRTHIHHWQSTASAKLLALSVFAWRLLFAAGGRVYAQSDGSDLEPAERLNRGIGIDDFDNPFGDNSALSTEPSGLVLLLNNILRVVFLLAGIYAFLKLVMAAFQFVSSEGDPKKVRSAWFQIWQSLAGLIVVVTSFVAAAILGRVLFGDAGAILNIRFFGVQ